MSTPAARSIRRWLLGWLIGGLLAAVVMAATGLYLQVRHEANELFDYELQAIAVTLPDHISAGRAVMTDPRFKEVVEDQVTISVWDLQGHPLYQSSEHFALDHLEPPGLHNLRAYERRWRVYVLRQPDRFVQVAQPTWVRDRLAARMAARIALPILAGLPLVALFIWVVVGRGLRPLNALARAIGTRTPDSLAPLTLGSALPVEIRPLVSALNTLLEQLAAALQAQRLFVADAAHELRSPLTALKLQLQLAQQEPHEATRALLLTKLDERLNRMIHLVQQLLALARTDAELSPAFAPLDLRALAGEVVGEYAPLAEHKRIDLGLVVRDPGPYRVQGDAAALFVCLRNLVDNAVRYAPAASRVDVTLSRQGAQIGLEVQDEGPGIAHPETERVFDRFYRGTAAMGAGATGSGLGLAIARRIAEHHRLTLQLCNRTAAHGQPGGLTVTMAGWQSMPETALPSRQ
jgi:two-component system, OmpR family, sensor kinase